MAPEVAGPTPAALLALWPCALIRDRSRDSCFRALRLKHWTGFVVLVGIVVNGAALPR